MSHSLSPVIEIDNEKCVNCHACISACPAKFCNDGSGSHVSINHDMCIGCGSCIDACQHGARSIIDDTEIFLNDLKKGEKIVTVIAPAVATNFPGKYLHLNSWFKSKVS